VTDVGTPNDSGGADGGASARALGDGAVPSVRNAGDADRDALRRSLSLGDVDVPVPAQLGERRRVIRFEVLGTPAPKGSTHATIVKGRAVNLPAGSSENRRKLRHWDIAIRETARNAVGPVDAPPFVACALVFHVEFRLTRPAGHYSKATGKLLPSAPRYPITKPDGDKLARQAADSMTGVVFDDDSRIVTWNIDKVYALPGQEGALFTIGSKA
jgi:Holliday junction resolvase RusA-like endonuclease